MPGSIPSGCGSVLDRFGDSAIAPAHQFKEHSSLPAGNKMFKCKLSCLDEEEALRGSLSVAELQRCQQIADPVLRARFVVSRGLRRQMLADCTGRSQAGLMFAEDGNSKPRLLDDDGWDFNISHAGNYVAAAVDRSAIGVDLELIREVRDMGRLVERCFHPLEAVAWARLPVSLKKEAFFIFWCAREAAIKCRGLGLGRGMSVTCIGPEILSGGQAEGAVGNAKLRVERLHAPTGYVLIVARDQGA